MSDAERSVQRNFLIPSHQAEWLRDHAFRTRRPQAEIVREALSDYRAKAEPAAEGPADSSPHRALVDRFRRGAGVDLQVLSDGSRETWGTTPP